MNSPPPTTLATNASEHNPLLSAKSSIQLTYEHVLDIRYNNKKPPRANSQINTNNNGHDL